MPIVYVTLDANALGAQPSRDVAVTFAPCFRHRSPTKSYRKDTDRRNPNEPHTRLPFTSRASAPIIHIHNQNPDISNSHVLVFFRELHWSNESHH